jgi:VWFA-related protein
MHGPKAIAIVLVAVLGVAPPAGRAQEPTESGIVERTERRLVQLDVTVTGSPDKVAALTALDFELVVGGRRVPEFTLDRICDPGAARTEERPAPVPAEPDEPVPAEPAPAAPAPGATTYLFYFDQNHLTGMGRQNAVEIGHDLIERLVTGGDRAMIVSSGQELRTFASITTDKNVLHDAIDTLERDRKQWDPWVASEDSRTREILDHLGDGRLEQAKTAARMHQAEERWRTEKELRRFSMILANLGDVDPPKVVVYFADTMRRNPGEHYLSLFSQHDRDFTMRAAEMDAFASGSSFERVVDEASAHGLRVYAIEAQGLTSDTPTTTGVFQRQGGGEDLVPGRRGLRDAQDSLVALALETGGQAFLHGVPAARIAKRIEQDMACVYVISFDGSDLPEDSPLAVSLRVKRPGVEAHSRGRLVVQSESRALTSRLLAAFAAPDAVDTEVVSRRSLVPTGFVDGRYRALVQLVVPGSPMTQATWDLGVSLVSRGEVREDASGRVTVPAAGLPVVFETEMSFRPGAFEIVSVAHDTTTDRVATGRLEGQWPDLDAAEATVGPIAVMQPDSAALFLRGDDVQQSGARALDPGELAKTDLPTALVALVCRGKSGKNKLRVERSVSGETAVPFEPLDLELDDGERCAQIRDVIPADVMTSGRFEYTVRIVRRGEPVAESKRSFAVLDPDEVGATASTDPSEG